ncbi:SDR family NAD(P)-dependent oxidoreductase [Nocardioidaceae bacterium]|nr:SDR family NAD(P)-dependent oxidoreductase [Nocardioidaceae bacterium]
MSSRARTVMITGATDGIGRLAALRLAEEGHELLLHGRSARKLAAVESEVEEAGASSVTTLRADLSSLAAVSDLAVLLETQLDADDGASLDAIVHNAGVYGAEDPRTADGLDVRFVVNTLAPYLLTRRLGPFLGAGSRVVSVASAAQSTVDLAALRGELQLSDGAAYAQSKLAMTMWTLHLSAESSPGPKPAYVALNPSSLMATKMVADAFGLSGSSANDPDRGARILQQAAVGEEFGEADGAWFDGDAGQAGEFAEPHADARDADLRRELVAAMDELLSDHVRS